MNKSFVISIIVAIVIVLVFLIVSIAKFFRIKFNISTKFIARTAIFSALSIILYTVPFLKFSVPFFPSFLEVHLDEIPAFIAGFAYGPFSGFLVIVIKTIVKLPLSTTMGVGELADLIYSIAFVVTAALIYKRFRSIKGALLSLGIATLVQVAVASIVTAFIMLDFYVFMLPNITKDMILAMCKKINPAIFDLQWGFVIYIGMPFNLFKDAIVIIITMLLYKRLHTFIDRF